MEHISDIVLKRATSSADFAAVKELFQEYAQSLSIDLDFQDFEAELATLPGEYVEPQGAIVLAYVDGVLAGCCAFRPMSSADYSNACEMKRLFVRKLFRGFGLGRRLAEAVMEAATVAGYFSILLDTLDEMDAARALYEELGFEEIEPYYYNPYPGAYFLKAQLC